ncbi:40-residue YVTN family beta-propeller repeat-containing protein [Haloferula helveola]|uniref:40-residue YVTN family beta-propeller repeat-containing protein n=2 Tax=Haloferula helveola TaxID=490095 RepID=A0ABM7RDE6_9BACT|nr:40-residue YVTN family beta-propeller repeat-containing protein [Haloferula helveola]
MALMALLCLGFAARLNAQTYRNFESRQSRPVCLSPDGSLLFAVNAPDGRLSVFDISNAANPAPVLIHEIPVGVEPVSVNVVSNDEAWVANQVSDSVSIVSLSERRVVATLHCKDEPNDLVFAGGKAFVCCAGTNELRVFDVATRSEEAVIPLQGVSPRSLEVSNDGSKIFAAFALSGNRTTLLPAGLAPPQPAPTNPALPPPPDAGLIVTADDPRLFPKPLMPDHDVAEISVPGLSVTRYFSGVGTVNFIVKPRPGSNELWVSNTDARNLVRFEPNQRGHSVDNRLTRITTGAAPTVAPFDLNPGIDYATLPNPAAKATAIAQPMDLAFEPDGLHLWVAGFGTDRIARVRASDGVVVDRVSVHPVDDGTPQTRTKRGPRGLALQASTGRLYVMNRISNTVSVMDTGTSSLLFESPVGSHDPTPVTIREGRGFLYDALLSGNGTQSCASCHIDADRDELAWDLGNPDGDLDIVTQFNPIVGTDVTFELHPMKGPMTTQTLKGIESHDPLHWRGDRPGFNAFNAAFDGLLGGSQLAPADMDAFREFIHTIVFEPNPNQNLNGTLPASFPSGDPNAGDPLAGLDIFVNDFYVPGLTCNTCHALPTGSNNLIIPGNIMGSPQDVKVPHLRNVYQKRFFTGSDIDPSLSGFGLTHDGLDPDLFTFLSRPVFGLFANDATVKRNISAFLHCLDTGTAPTVGFSKPVDQTTLAPGDSEWNILQNQAAGGNIDLVIHGEIEGEARSFVYRPGTDDYLSDSDSFGPLTRAELELLISTGDAVVTLMGVPDGSGERLGRDRDLDGIPNRDEPLPRLEIAIEGGLPKLRWPFDEPFMVLESSDTPGGSSPWQTVTEPRSTSAPWIEVQESGLESRRFFRLRRP